MIKIEYINSMKQLNKRVGETKFVDSMSVHLGQYGDSKHDILKSIKYAFSKEPGKGGFVLTAFHKNKLIGGLVMNKTGMSGYIPDYLLVYIAIDKRHRGKGFGKAIIEKALEYTEGGDVKLHVEYNNPAKKLYERLGFNNKYAEMRYNSNGKS